MSNEGKGSTPVGIVPLERRLVLDPHSIDAVRNTETPGRRSSRLFSERIETERLRLERLSHDTVDVFALHDFYSPADGAEEMFEYWDSPHHRTLKETCEYLDEAERLWEEAEGAKYVIRPNEGEGVAAT